MRLSYDVVKELTQLIAEARLKIIKERNTTLLDEVLEKLEILVDSKSKLADFDELKSDMEYLKEYYDEESWNDVTRWLTNIDSTIREMFSHYIEAVKTKQGNMKQSKKTTVFDGDFE